MNRNALLSGGLLVLAGVIMVLTFLSSPGNGDGVAETASAGRMGAPRRRGVLPEAARPAKPASRKPRGGAGPAPLRGPGMQAGAGAPQPTHGAVAAAATPRQQAVAAWEALLDQVIEQKEVSASAQAQRVKEAFDGLDGEDQMDGVQRALSLLPSAQFPALYGILFDKAEAPEVLDAIFSDALNRPEELKNALMKELRKDREHPLFPESARILEVVEPEAE